MNLITLARIGIHLGAFLPFVWLVLVIILGGEDLGADPAKEIQHFLGFTSLTLFVLLFVLRFLFSIKRAFHYQILHRPLGLWAFVYLVLHILSYLLLELGGDMALFMHELSTRVYLIIGIVSFGLFLITLLTVSPLKHYFAKLGINLHKLSYLAVILGAIHYFLSTKNVEVMAVVYHVIILGCIVIGYVIKQNRHRPVK